MRLTELLREAKDREKKPAVEKIDEHPKASVFMNALASAEGLSFLKARLRVPRESQGGGCPWPKCGWPVEPLPQGATVAEKGATRPTAPEVERDGEYVRFKDCTTSFRVEELRDDINLNNLLNGLYLSDQQMLKLLVVTEEANERRVQDERTIHEANRAIASALDAMRRAAQAGGYAEQAFREGTWPQGAYTCAHEATTIDNVKAKEDPNLVDLEVRVSEVLSEGQRKVVEAYKSCLIPSRDMKDPLRIGQAEGEKPKFERQLGQVRSAPAKDLADVIEMAVGEVIEHQMEHEHSQFTRKERADEEARLAGLFQQARAMSDIDFHLKEKGISASMEVPEKDVKAKERAARLKAEHDGTGKAHALGKVGRLMLDPEMARILAERLARSKSFQGSAKVDLDSIEAADTCHGGHCGIH